MANIKAIKGMNDLLPAQSAVWQYLDAVVAELFAGYGYAQIRLPIVEQTDLFKRSIGEVTDIVEKEMYTFSSHSDTSLTLRPEGTAGCVRACIQHALLDNNQIQRLWYTGPMFRYERPQKGRYRQFHQIGVESFGMSGPDIDAEMILMTARLWQRLGVSEHVELQLNSIGSLESRARYKKDLRSFLAERVEQLDEDSVRRLETNPLRILDSKNAQTQALLSGAPNLLDYLDDEARAHFAGLTRLLDTAGIAYRINERLVRGLDYYSNTVFEWVTDKLGAQSTVCAGGRYDGLVEQLGGRATPAVGFAMGIERLVLLLETTAALPAEIEDSLDAYLVNVGDEKVSQLAVTVGEHLRTIYPGFRLLTHCGGGSFKSQMKKADASSAKVALIIGDDEAEKGEVSVKLLRQQGGDQQRRVTLRELDALIAELFAYQRPND